MTRPHQNLLVLSIFCAMCIIVFVHLFLFPLYENLPRKKAMKYLGDYEQSLCMTNLKPIAVPLVWRQHCPKDGIVTVSQGGRLGNQMWEYASVWAVARRTGLEPYVPRCIRKVLDEVFDDLSIPPLGYVAHCLAKWDSVIKTPEYWTYTNQSILLPKFAVLPDLVLSWADDIRHEFRFKRRLTETSQKVLKTAGQLLNTTNTVYVGIHVRRTDYRNYLWRTRRIFLADADYFLTAMDYFRAKYSGNVAFLVVSDDPSWCRHNLITDHNDVFIVSKRGVTSPGQDLAIMAACNHSIIDYGTFGVWGAILASGETILYNISKHSSTRISELLPNWHVMN
ncbi:galactoside 2-alpha-L-fucosyltransferase SEC1-like [Anabrus simplex]|uniref:galactoside 2-alpha-L-fucosyltransferase SEC1-like n=1 Tax=Anabrus simplex TaxID=316456 RepID=UPI0034DD7366